MAVRAFLSHASSDKGFVEAVANHLRPGTFELDSVTFEAGLLNAEAIVDALKRSDLFCLFVSDTALRSSYVDFETRLGVEFIAKGRVSRLLIVCLDESAFNGLSDNTKLFNVIRRAGEPESVARLIQGTMIGASQDRGGQAHPFIGREEEMLSLERQVTDHDRPISKAIFISGNAGSGRRTIAHKFYSDQFPQVGAVLPTIRIDAFSGHDELFRQVLVALRPSMSATQLRTYLQGFEVASKRERPKLIASHINALLTANEAAFLVDTGGLLTDEGRLTDEMDEVVSELRDRPHPPAIFISRRMVPNRFRRRQDDLSYLALNSLTRESSIRLISKLLRDAGLTPSNEELDVLVSMSDGHPFNFYRMMDDVSRLGLAAFLANPSGFIEWKHRYSSEYLSKIALGGGDVQVLALLTELPELDFESIVGALAIEEKDASDALERLCDFHLVETRNGTFSLAPAVRGAVERDPRILLKPDVQAKAIRYLAESLALRIEEGTAPIALVEAAVLTAIETGTIKSGFAAAFLLPSHHAMLAKRYYDQRRWEESIREAKEALKGSARLSLDGRIAAYRYLCLAAARTGADDEFTSGIRELDSISTTPWARSNVAFLKGFNLRFRGNLPEAEEYFRKSYDLSPGNISAAREIAAICLARNSLDEAERFAREAHSHARTNPFLLDILLGVLIRKHGKAAHNIPEIRDAFEMLEKADEESGRSFYATRRAELEHLWGDNRQALSLITAAAKRTPTIFEPRRLFAEILLKDGNKAKAFEQIEIMREMVNGKDPNERRSNLRLYLETKAHYLTDIGRYEEAKNIYNDRSMFDLDEQRSAIKEIQTVQAYRGR